MYVVYWVLIVVYHCIIPSQHLNSMMLLKYARPAQGKDKSNSVYKHTELRLVRERRSEGVLNIFSLLWLSWWWDVKKGVKGSH